MEPQNRIAPLTLSHTQERQTPRNDFGEVLSRTAGAVVQIGSGFMGAVPGAGPVLGAAVTGVRQLLSVASQATTSSSATSLPRGTSEIPESASGRAFDLMEASAVLQENNQVFSLKYLNLQNAMQKESREFNAVSNIMKTRHDSAKAAINNVR